MTVWNRYALMLTVAAGAALSAAGYSAWRAGQQLGAVLPAAANQSSHAQRAVAARPVAMQPAANAIQTPLDEPPPFLHAFDLEPDPADAEPSDPPTETDPELAAALSELLSDPDPDVRSEAAALLELWRQE